MSASKKVDTISFCFFAIFGLPHRAQIGGAQYQGGGGVWAKGAGI